MWRIQTAIGESGLSESVLLCSKLSVKRFPLLVSLRPVAVWHYHTVVNPPPSDVCEETPFVMFEGWKQVHVFLLRFLSLLYHCCWWENHSLLCPFILYTIKRRERFFKCRLNCAGKHCHSNNNKAGVKRIYQRKWWLLVLWRPSWLRWRRNNTHLVGGMGGGLDLWWLPAVHLKVISSLRLTHVLLLHYMPASSEPHTCSHTHTHTHSISY